tara:strand:+ start:51 stop:578 length:528 start_codon:yes stop_codon:yes gene_type:complete
MLKNLLRSRPAAVDGNALYGLAVIQARRPDFYTRLGVDDRIDARFELYTLHVLLLVLRLRDDGDRGGEAAQILFDTYVSALDNSLRELGVGDVSVGKKMRKLGESLYGRMTAYEAPLRAGDEDALAASLARNVYSHDDGAAAAPLARYVIASRAALAGQEFNAVVRQPEWAEISA